MSVNRRINLDIDVVYQGESAECGLSAVCMVANALGHRQSLSELRRRFPISSSGASLAEIVDILEQLGIDACAVKFDLADTARLETPSILHYGGNHYVVAIERAGSLIRIFNPATGEFAMPASELMMHLSGYAIAIETGTSNAIVDKESWCSRLLKIFMADHPLAHRSLPVSWGYVIGALVLGMVGLLTPLLFSLVFDRQDLLKRWPHYLVFSAFGLIFIFSSWASFNLEKLNIKSIVRRANIHNPLMFNHLLRKCMTYFDKRISEHVQQRLESYNDAVMMYPVLVARRNVSFVLMLLFLAAMFVVSPALALVGTSSLVVMGLLSVKLSRNMSVGVANGAAGGITADVA